MLAQLLDFLGTGRIGLLGFGREGQSSYRFLRRHFPTRPLIIADQNFVLLDDPNAQLICGENYLEVLYSCDLLIKSPGVSLKDNAIPENLRITCQTDLFLRFAQCKKVGVTGTKGKTTTSVLIYDMLCSSGVAAKLIGNVGVPVLDCFEEIDGYIAVIELSSHQLEFTRASPQVAVWTNLYEEHLDHYTGGFVGYAAAKAQICNHQCPEDLFILNADQPLHEWADLTPCPAQRVYIGLDESDSFLRSLDNSNPRLRGDHNRQDIYFAATAALAVGATQDGIRRAVAEFRGIPHRMCPVSEAGDITWVDDCISTIPRAVLFAIDALQDVDTLMIGGLDRGLDYQDFARELAQRTVRNIICMPDTGHAIAKLLEDSSQNIVCVATMEEAVQAAFAHTQPGKTCLLSPAAASYNVYKDFEHKGRHFAQCINSSAAVTPLCPE
ncbi:MAG: UDP-N-acetylmuramoyl-L-alanine--D-glutamate ligase [Oscillospiraceae bacterium]|nr:UDP-N-acetylmuramoyl-L-alanine--D-glutamate ligase [Oscillospiraceae bacterium]